VEGLSLERKRQLAYELNLCRRHFSNAQKREIAEALLKVCTFWSDRRIARTAGIDHKTVAKYRRRLMAVGEVPHVQARIGDDDRRYKTKRVISHTPKEHQKAVQAVRTLPESCTGKIVDSVTAERRANRTRKAKERKAKEGIKMPGDSIQLLHCQFQELEKVGQIKPESVNAIITDIPYDGKFLEQLPELAEFAERVLVNGGIFASHVGVGYLDHVLRHLSAKLNYGWTISTYWMGEGTQIQMKPVTNKWIPVVVYSKGNWNKEIRRFPDTIHLGDKERDWHPWQRTLDEVETLVRYFTNPGDLVVEPCGGGFTTAVACRNLRRRCIACDCDPDAVAKGRQRLAKN
jgi:site-specific DNA-methyltransferase (adenine-specific)